MVQEDAEIVQDTSEYSFEGNLLVVPVFITEFEETYHGSSQDEEYSSRGTTREDVIEVECPISFVYNDDDPSEEYVGEAESVDFIGSRSWDSIEIQDAETVTFVDGGDVYIASFDASPLDPYRA